MSSYCHHKNRRKKILYRVLAGTLIFLFIIGLTVLITWAILKPQKPHFILQDASLYAFNVTSNPTLLSTNFQLTISSRNPNSKIGIYYDKLHVFATYRSQQITYYTTIPSNYQDHKEVNLWSPFVYGTNVPVAPYNGLALSQDQANGAIWMMVKINGRVRWKVGSITTGSYNIHVTCPAYIPFGNSNAGLTIVGGVKYQLSTDCAVSV
ncbi:Late embryogenesis abundant protein, LEA-14 [Heracleum sosnowskyi]|uniref:Late embryogenesis abundant protein, LEA-14 n=1 Tax=Heracleum sosnowskyi TaxID=360622 RepID=A0AAD8ITC2_9APIA|nr:Late embryogenesis abundant protein, LEA-14 [Heracleum sosnowskyi]